MCLTNPIPTLPTLPAPLTLSLNTPQLPTIGDLEFCCKLFTISIKTPPLPIPSTVLNPGVIAAMNGYITALNTYLKAIPLKCPNE